MNNKLKSILSVGAITMLTASSMLPVNALCKNTCTKHIVSRNVYIYVNGVKFKLPLTPECPNIQCKPEFKPQENTNTNCNTSTNNNNTVNKPNSSTQNNNTVVTKPNNSITHNDNNTNVSKPNNNNTQNNNNTNVTNKPQQNNTNSTTNENFSSYQQQVLDLVNAERTKRGLSPLTLDAKLSSVATKKSEDMVNRHYFDHTSPTYGSPFDMMQQFGISYQTAGENIAKGQRTPEEVMNSWMNSSGHRANILNPNFKKLGVGIAKDSNGTIHWTQMFIG